MSYFETAGDLDDEWCGVSSEEREAVTAAMEAREADLAELPIWELEDALSALFLCKREHCRTHAGLDDARALIERVIYNLESR